MNNDFKVPTLDEVKHDVDIVYGILDILDNTYRAYNNNYIMRYYKNRGISLKNIFITDMLNWLSFLGWGDNHIDVNEVRFINEILNLNLTQLDVLDIVKNLDVETLSNIPAIFAIFIEYEAISGRDFKDGSIVEALFSLFFVAGSYLIVCDGDVDDNEVKGMTLYMENLKNNIRTFNLRAVHNRILDQV